VTSNNKAKNGYNLILAAIVLSGVVIILSLLFLLFDSHDQNVGSADQESNQAEILEKSSQAERDATQRTEQAIELDKKKEKIKASGLGKNVASGKVNLTILDDQTGNPLGNLEYIIVNEDLGIRTVAEGKTDAEGKAVIGSIPEGILIVRTERKPPNCYGFRTFKMDVGQTRDVELRVGRGGSLVGRVVNDHGDPLKGFKIYLKNAPIIGSLFLMFGGGQGKHALAAETDSGGCFRIDNLIDVPTGISIVDSKEKVSHWYKPNITIKDPEREDRRRMHVSRSVKEEEVKDIGDIVFKSSSHFIGRVEDAAGDPVAGAFVTARTDLVTLMEFEFGDFSKVVEDTPLSEKFNLHPDDSVTNVTGAFAITVADTSRWYNKALVWTKTGVRQAFKLPEIKPGETADDIVFRLRDDTLFELEFRDAKGELTGPWGKKKGLVKYISFKGRDWQFLTGDRVCVNVALVDGKGMVRHRPNVDPDGIARLQISSPIEDIERFEILVPGYMPVNDELEAGVYYGARRVYNLKKVHKIPLRIKWTKGEENIALTAGKLRLHACLLPPESRKDDDVKHFARKCCGLCSTGNLVLNKGKDKLQYIAAKSKSSQKP